MNTDNSTVRIIVDRKYLLRLEFLISSSCKLSLILDVRNRESTRNRNNHCATLRIWGGFGARAAGRRRESGSVEIATLGVVSAYSASLRLETLLEIYRRDAENTEFAQRKVKPGHPRIPATMQGINLSDKVTVDCEL